MKLFKSIQMNKYFEKVMSILNLFFWFAIVGFHDYVPWYLFSLYGGFVGLSSFVLWRYNDMQDQAFELGVMSEKMKSFYEQHNIEIR